MDLKVWETILDMLYYYIKNYLKKTMFQSFKTHVTPQGTAGNSNTPPKLLVIYRHELYLEKISNLKGKMTTL